MLPNLRHLSYLVTVAEQGSITKAAEILGVSQPAISAAIKGLETEFELRLFVRQPAQGLAPTPAGRQFVTRARHLLEDAHDFEMRVTGLSREPVGQLELGCFLPTAPFLIPPILKALARQHPGITLRVHEGDLGEITQFLKNGSVDIALTYDMALDNDLKYEPLIETRPYALLSKRDPLSRKAEVSLKELADKPLMLLDLPVTRDFFQALFAVLGIQPTIGSQPRSYEMVRSLVGAGAGYSLLIMRPLSNHSYDGSQLACRPLADEVPKPKVVLASSKQAVPTRLVNAFSEVCRTVFRDMKTMDRFLVRN